MYMPGQRLIKLVWFSPVLNAYTCQTFGDKNEAIALKAELAANGIIAQYARR